MVAVAITRDEQDAAGLRRAASASRDAGAARRMLALALILDGRPRSEAAALCGMDRQTLRDWVHRYNAEGLAGLSDRQGAVGPKPRLSPEQTAAVAELVRAGPDPAEHGVVRWRRVDLAAVIAARFGVTLAERTRGKPIEPWWQDEARVGQQGTLTRVWADKGSRPPAPRDQRYRWAYLFGAVCPARGTGAGLVLPVANGHAMNEHLAEIGRQVAPGAHAVVTLDGERPRRRASAHHLHRHTQVGNGQGMRPLV